jgi:Large polyvalent protein associated domain 38/ADP-Ribosyltransferase in polyvalent proteins
MSALEFIPRAKEAGFTDEEIGNYVSKIGGNAISAGFSQQEVMDSLGMSEPDDAPIRDMIQNNLKAFDQTPQQEGQVQKVNSLTDAIEAGLQVSTSGLALRGKMPDKVLPEDAPWYNRAAMNTAQVIGDVPAMVAGAVAGGVVGAEGGPVAAISATAGAFALPTAMRQTLMDYYKKGQFKNFPDFWERVTPIAIETGKSWLTGAATGGAGRVVGSIAGPTLEATTTPGVAKVGTEVGKLGAEIGAMVTVGKALEGEAPTAQDFLDASVVMFGLKGATSGSHLLMDVYGKYNKKPAEVMQDAKTDPTIQQDLVMGVEPAAYAKMSEPAPQQKKQEKHPETSSEAPTGSVTIPEGEIANQLKQDFGGDATSLLDAGKIRIVQNVEELNKATGGEHPEDAQAMYDPVSDTTYLVGENMEPAKVKGVVLHEIGVHAGMEEMLGRSQFERLLSEVSSRADRGEGLFAEARDAVPKDTRPEHMREETLAYLVENHPELPLVQRVKARVRAWAYRKFDFARNRLTLNDADITALAAASLRQYARRAAMEAGKGGAPFYSQVNQTDTKKFKDWFGESKVVDENGKPIIGYHYTSKDFSEFGKTNDLGFHFGTEGQANYRAGNYLNEGGNIIPAYLRIKNPIQLSDHAWDTPVTLAESLRKLDANGDLSKAAEKWQSLKNEKISEDLTIDHYRSAEREYHRAVKEAKDESMALARKLLEANGYDGVVYKNQVEGKGDSYIAFKPEQIKSAIGNSGEFSPTNPDIRYSRKSEDIPFGKSEKVRAASIEDVRKADEFERQYGIKPYYSEGQLEVDVEPETNPKYSIKKEGKYGEHPTLGLPLNKNGTVTLYFPTTNEMARKVVQDKKLRASDPQANRIYLTNESSAGKVAAEKGGIEQEVGGANVLVHIDPNLLHLDAEFEDGRKDFYIQLAEGKSFVDKMRMSKIFTLNKPRTEAISADVTFGDIGKGVAEAITALDGLSLKDRRALVKQAKQILKKEHNVSSLLTENGKLEKTRVGDYGLTYEGESVASMGLGLASAQKLNLKKLTTCLKSAICEALCLGETSGQNLLYGGEGQFRSGPRLSQYLKTEALVLHPKEFATLLSHEISLFEAWAAKTTDKALNPETGKREPVEKQSYKAAIRLNVTSDFPPSVFEALIKAHPNVEFYDYTKLTTEKISENHHLTYSSTGASQVVNGQEIYNPHSNWTKMVKRMNQGFNVAMAFTDRNEMPKFVVDEATGQKFKVWNGDNYDARFLDPKQPDGIGMIIGLTNKDRTTMPGLAAEKHNGFFIDYRPEIHGDTVTIPDQTKIKPNFANSNQATLKTGSDVMYSRKPTVSNDEQAILDRISQDEQKRPPLTLDQIYRTVIDDLNPIKGVAPEAYQTMRLVRGVYGKVDQFLKYGTFDFRSYVTNGESLNDILDPIKNELDQFRAYMVSRRAVEQEAKGKATGMPLAEANAVIHANDAKFRPVFQRLVDYQDRVLNYLRDAGVVSLEAYDAIKEANKSYVPFFRLMEDDPNGPIGSSKNLKNPIKTFKGSEKIVIDPIESIIKNTYLYVELAERNAANRELVDEIEANPELEGLVTKVPTPMRPIEVTEEETAKFLEENGLNPTDANAFTIFRPNHVPLKDTEFVLYRDGKREIYETTRDIAGAVRSLDKESISLWMKILSKPASLLRAGATLSPDFPIRNVMRDQVSAFVFSQDGYKPYLDLVRGAASLIKKDADFQNWLKSGGANSAMVSIDRHYIQENVFKLNRDVHFMDKVWNVAKSPIEFLRISSELLENATRLGEFKRASEGAQSKEELQSAGFQSREITLDFARAGTQSRALNMISAFYNAQLQGVDRAVRAFKDDPVPTLAKVGVSITLPSVLLWMANHDDPRWKEIPTWQRDLFWIVMTKDHIYRIPKPFELGVLFGSAVEHALDGIAGQADKKGVTEFLKTAAFGLFPNPMPTAASPIFEQITNHSFLSGHDLVPARLEKLLPEFRYTDYTTETAKFLGHVFGVVPGLKDNSITAPMIMENYVRQWTGGLGNYALQLGDAALRKAGLLPDPVQPAKSLAELPVIKAFMIRYPSASAESLAKFQEDYAKRKMNLDTVKMLASSGDIKAIMLMSRLNPSDLVTLDGVNKAISDHTQLIHMINKMDIEPGQKDDEKARDALATQKRQLIDGAYNNMIEMARMGNGIMKEIDSAFDNK